MRWLLLVAGLTVAGCTAPRQIMDRDDFLAEASRTYATHDKEKVIKAAERVLRNSDPSDWEFRYNADGFTGLRRFFIYAVIAATNGREKWEFTARESSQGTQAGLTISEAGTASSGYSVNNYEGAMNNIELYRLFWARVDYVLGVRQDWPTCESALKAVRARGENSASLGGLCGSTSQGRNATPPARV